VEAGSLAPAVLWDRGCVSTGRAYVHGVCASACCKELSVRCARFVTTQSVRSVQHAGCVA
jgi:hypothetical protein